MIMANHDEYSKQNEEQENKRFQSDAEKLANKHLADPNHVITDEEMAKIRVGMTPPPDEPTRQAIEDGEDRIADQKSDKEDDAIPGAQKITPWDVVK
jgi:hypothetical protein